MPWLRSRVERASGLTTWAIEWREAGKVRHRPLGAISEAEANLELATLKAGKSRPSAAKQEITARRAADGYLKHLRASGRRPGTIEHDQDKLKPLLDAWEAVPMGKWSRAMLEEFLADRGWGPSRVRQALGVYRRLIAWCGAVGYACGDFVAGFKPPRLRPPDDRQVLSAEQSRKLLDAARDHYLEVPVALALLTGLSRSDLRSLTWKEVDLDRGLITRPRSKTGRSLRLPMSATLREVLQRRRQGTGLVCPRLPKSDSSLYKALHRLCDRAGVPHGGWHRLRHTAATLLVAAGTDVATIGRILGHRPGSVVTLRYLHTDDERLRRAAAAVAAAIRGA
jgi:integrase